MPSTQDLTQRSTSAQDHNASLSDRDTAIEEDLAKVTINNKQTTQFDCVRKVLETTELLETILLRLPLPKLLKAQRVSKTFQAAIKGSIQIKKALFFTPAEGRHHLDGGPIFNPIFLKYDSKIILHVRGINFKYEFPQEIPITGGKFKVDVRRALERDLDWSLFGPQFNGSWKDMYISRPPWDVMVKFEEYPERKRIRSPTMGELLEGVCDEYLRFSAD